jgi:hypothetical protein
MLFTEFREIDSSAVELAIPLNTVHVNRVYYHHMSTYLIQKGDLVTPAPKPKVKLFHTDIDKAFDTPLLVRVRAVRGFVSGVFFQRRGEISVP